MLLSQKQKRDTSGFTIVELLVVIVIIAILASIVIVTYGGVRRNAMSSLLKDTLASTAKSLEMRALETNEYSLFPSSLTLSDQVGVALTEVDDASKTFCINVTTPTYNDLSYHMEKDGVSSPGLCPGGVVLTKGSYNYDAGTSVDPSTTLPSAVTVEGDKYGFKVATNDTWTQVAMTWNSRGDATQWQLQARLLPSGAWYARSSSGTSTYSETTMSGSNVLAPTTTSQTWTTGLPTSIGQAYEYRLRYKKADASYSDWTTVSLAPLANRPIPTISNLKATPNTNWSQVSITWNSPGTFVNMPGIVYQLQARLAPSGLWHARSSSGTNSYSETTMSGSNVLAPTTTSQTWTAGFPTSIGQTYEYRIRIASSSDSTVYGSWSTTSLSPIASVNDIPKITGFAVTPNANWSQVAITWNSPGAFVNMPGIVYQLQERQLPSGLWHARSSGGTNIYSESSTTGSNALAPTTTSQTWTSGYPTATGQSYEYRIRIASSSDSTVYGEWVTLTLNR